MFRPMLTSTLGDFRDVECWIFDLDNTLYAWDANLHGAIEERICLFVQREMGLDKGRAWELQKTYYREFGTTLSGLMQHHGTNAEDYLAFVNDLDLSEITDEPRLVAGLARLPGRRFIFTSNCGHHAMRVIEKLGIAHLFEDIWDIRTTAFVSKPHRCAYDAVIGKDNIAPQRTAMFDDIIANLHVPHQLGMATVWLRHARPSASLAHVHHQTDDLSRFLQIIEVRAPA